MRGAEGLELVDSLGAPTIIADGCEYQISGGDIWLMPYCVQPSAWPRDGMEKPILVRIRLPLAALRTIIRPMLRVVG